MPDGGMRTGSGGERRETAWGNSDGDGFTLLELMISMTILAMLVVILFGGFRVGVRAWEKGENELEGRQRQRIVLDLLRRQLASACATETLDGSGQPVLFRGEHKSMAFVSHVSLAPGSMSGPVLVRYDVAPDPGGTDAERLVFTERNASRAGGGTAAREAAEADVSEILSGVKSIGFEYWKSRPDKESSPWQERWDPAVEVAPPRAIRIALRENDDKAPVYVIAAAGR